MKTTRATKRKREARAGSTLACQRVWMIRELMKPVLLDRQLSGRRATLLEGMKRPPRTCRVRLDLLPSRVHYLKGPRGRLALMPIRAWEVLTMLLGPLTRLMIMVGPPTTERIPRLGERRRAHGSAGGGKREKRQGSNQQMMATTTTRIRMAMMPSMIENGQEDEGMALIRRAAATELQVLPQDRYFPRHRQGRQLSPPM
mmetsp:Transcript_34373/g.69381  ORF Transcript_34373/g.69381 Transcript_34373/m.69381 type:complete len:200 (+) Transcript_34373:1384-1983(+)